MNDRELWESISEIWLAFITTRESEHMRQVFYMNYLSYDTLSIKKHIYGIDVNGCNYSDTELKHINATGSIEDGVFQFNDEIRTKLEIIFL